MARFLIADYKKRKKAGSEERFFKVSDCPDAVKDTVFLCGKCVQTNQLGNIIYGIIAFEMGMVEEARMYGQGKLKLPFGSGPQGPDIPWTDQGQGYREQAFDIGVEYEKLIKFGYKNIDICDLMNRNTKGRIDTGCENLSPCKATFNGPQTDLDAKTAVDKSGN